MTTEERAEARTSPPLLTTSGSRHGPPAAVQMLAFVLLSVAATVVMLHTLLAPTPLPAALSLAPRFLAIRGYRLKPLAGTGAVAGRRLAYSGVHRFAVQADTGGPVLQLTLVNLHSRSHETFQLAALTSGADAPSGLTLEKRRLRPGAVATAVGTLAESSGQSGRLALQTCLIGGRPGEPLRGGVTQQQLEDVYNSREQRLAGPLGLVREALKELSPWQSLRWECMLVSLSVSAGEPGAEASLLRFWRTAAPNLARLVP